MKSPILALFLLSFTFKAKPLSGAHHEPLLEGTGEKVRTGTDYYVLSTLPGTGDAGSLSTSNGREKTCPLDVVQEYWNLLRVKPITLSLANEEGVVYESTDLNIKFSTTSSTCNEPTAWKVDDYDESTGQWFITTGGTVGNPGAHTLRSWFKFEKVTLNVYKLVHCPEVCPSCVTLCSNVGIYSDNGVRRLALSESPLTFTFIRKRLL